MSEIIVDRMKQIMQQVTAAGKLGSQPECLHHHPLAIWNLGVDGLAAIVLLGTACSWLTQASTATSLSDLSSTQATLASMSQRTAIVQ